MFDTLTREWIEKKNRVKSICGITYTEWYNGRRLSLIMDIELKYFRNLRTLTIIKLMVFF